MKRKYYWKTLYDGMMSTLCNRIDSHNEKYSKSKGFRASYPARLKKTEINTLHNVVKQWSKQQAANINAGRPVTNILSTNNRDAQGGKGDSSNTARHLGKLAFSGFLLGERVSEDAEVRYRCQFTQGGKGYGIRPLKLFHGSARNYDLLIDPSIFPSGNIPPGVTTRS